MTGQHTEIAFRTRHVDLVDLTGQEKLLGRDEIELECGHMKHLLRSRTPSP
jgi:hypothetical protein